MDERSMNEKWHRAHPMPQNPSAEARLRWHLAHQKACACRPIPPKLLQMVRAREAVTDGRARCTWAGTDSLYVPYHDEEWGVVSHDDRHLFEMIILEGAQAGLSWITILRKRENYRRAFDRFDPKKIATYDAKKVKALMNDAGIVRNRAKIEGTVASARAYLKIMDEGPGFSKLLWGFVDGKPKLNAFKTTAS